jgi:hypothetical protein
MARPPKQAFSQLDGLPASDDPEVSALMGAVAGLSRQGVDTLVRNLLRAALGHERSGSKEHLTYFAVDTLFTMRLRSDPQNKGAFDDGSGTPAQAGELEDIDAVLARHGMT